MRDTPAVRPFSSSLQYYNKHNFRSRAVRSKPAVLLRQQSLCLTAIAKSPGNYLCIRMSIKLRVQNNGVFLTDTILS